MSKAIPIHTPGTSVLADEASEPRSIPRRRLLKGGVIYYNERHSTLSCTVRDMSDCGARVRTTGSVDAPDTFELFIELDGLWVDCEVVWRGKGETGVRFTSEMVKQAPSRRQVLQQHQTAIAKPSLRRKPKHI